MQTKMQSWGIIGVGQLGAGPIEGVHRTDSPPKLCLSPRSKLRVREPTARFPVEVAVDNQAIVDACESVLVACRERGRG